MARDIGVHTKTVWKHTNEKAIMEAASEPIGLGQTVTFEATHFLVRQRLTSKMTEYQEPVLFVDDMQKGAFKSLRHVHEFKQLADKTIMTDTLYFEAPFGMLGKAVERLILKKYMRKFLEHRNQQLKIWIEQR
ncbi:SRPBCC family protein [Paenibacillus sp. BIHB 4019]|uniref:SRPBCC family protein n=1 Tax=Paenibacillus sp. BIHB 4019 TaxID=1870819 RepID=UPI001F267199|nr:SRPBCC family protein [Paenibacillus sp. BIHB 4019]